MTTSEFRQFEKNIDYARRLIAGGDTFEDMRNAMPNFEDRSLADPDDLYRAAWVQAVSALDHWMHREIVRRAVALINDTGRERPEALSRLAIPFGSVERMRREPIANIFRDYLENYLAWQSLQTIEKIQGAIRLVIIKTPGAIWSEVANSLAKTPEQVKLRHAGVISRRNQIAHEADLLPDGTRRPITKDDATGAVQWIDDLAHALAKILD